MGSKKSSLAIWLSIMADYASFYTALLFIVLIMGLCFLDRTPLIQEEDCDDQAEMITGVDNMHDQPCNELYVVGKGETLYTISEKCGDPFVFERNPHVHDPDEVYPGVVIKITPIMSRKVLRG